MERPISSHDAVVWLASESPRAPRRGRLGATRVRAVRHCCGDALGRGDGEQLLRVEDAAEGRLLEGLPDVDGAVEVEGEAHLAQAHGFGEHALAFEDVDVGRGGLEGEGQLATGGEGCQVGKARKDLVELEDAQGVFIHWIEL